MLRALYVLGCLAILGLAWLWAHDTTPPPAPATQTPRSAGPLIGGQSPTPPPPPAALTSPSRPTHAAARPTPTVPPTTAPSVALATPWPPAAAITPDEATGHTLIIQDRNFAGGSQPPDGVYRDRTARIITGWTGTISARSVLSAPFNLNLTADGPVREATLTLVGLNSPRSPAPRLRVTLNDVVVYEGSSLLPSDDSAGPDSPVNWGGARWTVPETAFRQAGNVVVITNLADSPTRFIAVDYLMLVWKR